MSTPAIVPVATLIAPDVSAAMQPVAPAAASGGVSFSGLLTGGLQKANDDVLNAEKLSRDFALSDSVPVHQVTYALEQARMSLGLVMQVRGRVLDAYQQLMNMQI
jgi:flagellar hook-basal body complex protein FliE